ncbi:MAG: phosphoribosylanthranilate isomerase [Pseudomonadota bacterium]
MTSDRTRIKVCGVTQPQQARELCALGVDAIGMIMLESSPRYVPVDTAIKIREAVTPFVNLVAVTVDLDPVQINDLATSIGFTTVQWHGDEPADWLGQVNLPSIKAIRPQTQSEVLTAISDYRSAQGLLLDAHVQGQYGGTGKQLDEGIWPTPLQRDSAPPLILAGGLSPENLSEALAKTKPFAVDLNSGVEHIPGVKNLEKVRAAIEKVKEFDANR